MLVKVYIAPCGFVAHWFSHSGANSYEPIKVIFNAQAVTRTPDCQWLTQPKERLEA